MANHLSYEVLNQLVERRASPLEEARALRHLAKCARCRSEREWLERIRGMPSGGMRDRLDQLDDSSPFRINSEWLVSRVTS